jgi:beta-lactamase
MMVASKMGNLDIISVSLGSKSDLDRTKDQETEFIDIKKKTKMIYKEGQEMSKFKVKNVKKKQIKGILSENVYQLSNTTDYKFRVKDLETVAGKDGIKKGDVIGKLEVLSKGRVVENVDILAEEDSKALTLFEKVLRTVTFGLI